MTKGPSAAPAVRFLLAHIVTHVKRKSCRILHQRLKARQIHEKCRLMEDVGEKQQLAESLRLAATYIRKKLRYVYTRPTSDDRSLLSLRNDAM